MLMIQSVVRNIYFIFSLDISKYHAVIYSNICVSIYLQYSGFLKWRDILFLAPLSVRPSSVHLSVRPSVCPSHFRVRSISFRPLVGFTNNFAQMSSMMRRCAVPMFDQGRFKVKVTI